MPQIGMFGKSGAAAHGRRLRVTVSARCPSVAASGAAVSSANAVLELEVTSRTSNSERRDIDDFQLERTAATYTDVIIGH